MAVHQTIAHHHGFKVAQGKLLAASLLVIAGSAAFTAKVQAQSLPEPSEQGVIIYSRDLPSRSAIEPSAPGKASVIDTSPDDLIISAVDLGLQPITDHEAANVVAPLRLVGEAIAQPMQAGLAVLGSTGGGTNLGADNTNNSAGSGGGGVISNALGAIPTALGSMRSALGASQ